MNSEKTALELAFEKAEAAKNILTERERLELWKKTTVNPGYKEDIFKWLNRKLK